MTIDSSIGLDEPHDGKESGIDDEGRARKAREDGDSEAEGSDDAPERDLTREDIEAGNDHNVSSDQGNRSGTTNKIHDDSIDVGKP